MNIKIEGLSLGSHYKLTELPDYLKTAVNYQSCPICTSSKLKLLYRTSAKTNSEKMDTIDKILCKNCGHSFFNKVVTNETLHNYYKSGWNKAIELRTDEYKVKPNYSEWSPIHYLKALNLNKEARVLDFGCGTGDSLLSLQSEGFENLYGVEIGVGRAAIASRYFPDRIVNGDEHKLGELVAKVGKFDLIYANHVLEHIAEPKKIILRLSRILKPGGILAISVPAPGSETMLHSALYYPHLHAYSALSLKKCFEIVDMRAFHWTGSKHQLAVIGVKEEISDLSSEFIEVSDNPKHAIESFKISVADSNEIFDRYADRTKILAINFCHPKTNTRNKKSGLSVLSRFAKLFYTISDFLLKCSQTISPKLTENFTLKAYRKIVYKLRIMNGVDTIYVSKSNNRNNDVSESCQIYIQSSSSNGFLGK